MSQEYEGRSNIVLMTTHPEPELVFISYKGEENSRGELVIEKQLSLHERSPRIAEFFTDILIHPSGKLAIVSCYAGKLKIVTLKAGQYAQDFDVSYVTCSLLDVLTLKFMVQLTRSQRFLPCFSS